MSKLVTTVKLLRKPFLFMYVLGSYRILNWMPDKLFLKIAYRGHTGRWLNLKKPQRFTEKLQWLKLYERNPLHTQLVDKYEVRNFLEDKIDDKHLVKLYGVYDSFDEISWCELPDSFIMKCTHGCGCNHIVKNKTDVDKQALRKQFNKWMKKNPYPGTREWPYKNVKPRIICEELLVDESGYELKDYKFYCFNGTPKIVQFMSNRNSGKVNLNHFDLEWNEFGSGRKDHDRNINNVNSPKHLSDMIELSKILCKDFKFVRVDLYDTPDSVYFGELTFFPGSGFFEFIDDKENFLLGSWLDLSEVKKY